MTNAFCSTTDRFCTTNYRELCRRLAGRYDLDEARAIVRWVLDERFGLSMADILCDKVTELSADDRTELEKIMLRLEKGEPVQYVLGFADFCGRRFCVNPSVLIPRPETEELCRWIVDSWSEECGVRSEECGVRILDIGTGSGCIAITLAAEMPDAQVTAWDISEKALKVARKNAERNGVEVHFEKKDALHTPHFTKHTPHFTHIISNPPYICENEKNAMESHVLDHEPHTALFVPDNDPLLFYRTIAQYACHALKPKGQLYFEINPIYADDTARLLSELQFKQVTLREDSFGKKRFIRGWKN